MRRRAVIVAVGPISRLAVRKRSFHVIDRRAAGDPGGAGPEAAPDPALSPLNQEKAHALGLTSATGLVIGSIVGSGAFTMPAVIASAGSTGIIVLG